VRNADPIGEVHYPESDGQPMGETETHFLVILDLAHQLRWHLAGQQDHTHVAGNQFWYWVEGDPRRCVAPDVYVVVGVPQEPPRSIWKTWEDRCAPTVVFEVTSRSTADEDRGRKRANYEQLGTRELFLFDPLREYLTPPLQAWRRVGERLERARAPRAVGSGSPELRSEVLGLDLRVEGPRLVLVGRRGEQAPPFGRIREIVERAERRAAEAQQLLDLERERADQERERADRERARADAERERVLELEAKLRAAGMLPDDSD
jgi:Uma2 family endonuclease